MLVLRTAAVDGRQAGLLAMAGIALGWPVWAALSALGVTAVLSASRLAFEILRAAGVAYLCFLGIRALVRSWRAAPSPIAAQGSGPEVAVPTRRGAFRTGLVTNLLNPKVG